MIEENKQKTLKLMKQAQGILKKIIKMVEEEEYCMNIIQQSLAVQGFLKSADLMILKNHLNTCFKKGFESKQEKTQQKLIQEILKIISKTKT